MFKKKKMKNNQIHTPFVIDQKIIDVKREDALTSCVTFDHVPETLW